MLETFPDWDDFKSWVDDVRNTRALEHSRSHLQKLELDLEHVVEDVAALNEQLGSFQDINCRSLKAALADVEWQGTGRVLLSDFYKIGLEGKYLFIEYADYLRRLGALDESDPAHPKVIICELPGWACQLHDRDELPLGLLLRRVRESSRSVGELDRCTNGLPE